MARDGRGDHYACERGARPWAIGLGAGLRAAVSRTASPALLPHRIQDPAEAAASSLARRHLAVEDALVLAQELRNADTIQTALQAYEARRRPRVNWVQEQSLDAARAWGLPAAVRDSVLGEHGDQALRERYEPLRAEP